MDLDERLTPHFTWREVVRSSTATRFRIANEPPERLYPNITRQAELMERVRAHLKVPIFISSWYRSPGLNRAVRGARNSFHMLGLACDCMAPSYGSPLQVARALIPVVDDFGIDQLIYEFGEWLHIGQSLQEPRHEILTAYHDKRGAPAYAVGVIPLSVLEGT